MTPAGREILFLAHRVPFPPDRGDRIRSYNELAWLAKRAPVHVVAFADDAASEGAADGLRDMVASCHVVRRPRLPIGTVARAMATGGPLSPALFASAAFRATVARLTAERPLAAVFAFSGQMATHVPPLAADVRFVMDFCDVDSAKFAAYGAASRRPIAAVHRREARTLAAFERRVALRADASLLVSAAEATLFTARTGQAADVVENGVDLRRFDPAAAAPIEVGGAGPLLVFTGQMDYRPNVEAVAAFARDSLPHIPAARFAIVGRAPTDAVRALATDPRVIVTGEVPDTRPWLAAADIVVAPLRIARGIQNKVLEAMAMARPVVASSAAAQGIDAEPGRDIVVADGPAAEAAAITMLLGDRDQAAAIGRAGRARVEARYAWDAVLAPLQRHVFGHDG